MTIQVTVIFKSNYENYHKKIDRIFNCSHSHLRLEMKYATIKILNSGVCQKPSDRYLTVIKEYVVELEKSLFVVFR